LVDVTDRASIADAAERIRRELGRLDVLVNNAAISNTGKLPAMSTGEYAKFTRASNVSLDEVRAVWETNVFGILAVFTRRCCPSCARRREPASSMRQAALAR
jgi:NAD(P)-dependent dehydrogenase (short-subunit alcohol dehydrogenase family)